MSEDAAPREQTTMFADIVDSTGLYEAVGDAQAQTVLGRCMDLLTELAEDSGGFVQKKIGDEVLCVFDTPVQAARAAARMHGQVVGGHEKGLFPRAMRLRIGFEHGEVREQGGELFGSSVHTAARLAALAKAGQTLTSRETFERIPAPARPAHRAFGRVLLKGQKEERDVLELLWSHGSTVLAQQVAPQRPEGGIGAVELSVDGHTVRVDAEAPGASIGRDEICTLRVSGDAVSRLHGEVTLDQGFATYEDMSSNGSLLLPAEGASRELWRSSVRLTGRGVLRLGVHCEDAAAARVEFVCLPKESPAGD